MFCTAKEKSPYNHGFFLHNIARDPTVTATTQHAKNVSFLAMSIQNCAYSRRRNRESNGSTQQHRKKKNCRQHAKSGKIGDLAQDSYLEYDWSLDARSKSVELELSRLTVL
jgi:hypothetical protein